MPSLKRFTFPLILKNQVISRYHLHTAAALFLKLPTSNCLNTQGTSSWQGSAGGRKQIEKLPLSAILSPWRHPNTIHLLLRV